MKKFLFVISFCISTVSHATETIVIGASSVPHAEILKFAESSLAKAGIDLKIKEFNDYITPNLALSQKQLDANFFQHTPYLNEYNKTHGTDLVALATIHLEPMGIFANSNEAKFIKSKKAQDIVVGSKIAIPNDPTNEGRALNILAKNGLIKLKPNVTMPTKKDLTANPYKLAITELDASFITRAFTNKQIDLAVINSNFALLAGLNPVKTAVILESKTSPYANIIVVRKDEINQARFKTLVKVMQSSQMKQFIEKNYKGAVIPAF